MPTKKKSLLARIFYGVENILVIESVFLLIASFGATIIQNSVPCLVDMRIFRKKIES